MGDAQSTEQPLPAPHGDDGEAVDEYEFLDLLAELENFESIIAAFQDKRGGVPRRDYSTLLNTYRHTFTGAEAVTWIVWYLRRSMRVAVSRADALRVGVRLQERCVFEHLTRARTRLADSGSERFQLCPLVMLSEKRESPRLAASDLRALASRMGDSVTGVEIRERSHLLSVYPSCFVGSAAVDWLVRQLGTTRKTAVRVGRLLVEYGLVHHVTHEHRFKDEQLFYRFAPSHADLMRSLLALLGYASTITAMRDARRGVAAFARASSARAAVGDTCAAVSPASPTGTLASGAAASPMPVADACATGDAEPTFSGRALVDWLVSKQRVARKKAIRLAGWMLQAELLVACALSSRGFEPEESSIYRFTLSGLRDANTLESLAMRMSEQAGAELAVDASGSFTARDATSWIAGETDVSRPRAHDLLNALIEQKLVKFAPTEEIKATLGDSGVLLVLAVPRARVRMPTAERAAASLLASPAPRVGARVTVSHNPSPVASERGDLDSDDDNDGDSCEQGREGDCDEGSDFASASSEVELPTGALAALVLDGGCSRDAVEDNLGDNDTATRVRARAGGAALRPSPASPSADPELSLADRRAMLRSLSADRVQDVADASPDELFASTRASAQLRRVVAQPVATTCEGNVYIRDADL